MHRLRFADGPLAGRRVEVTAALVLGRQAADLAIEDPQVSRRHASVRPADDALEVEDLGSKNGTWVNGARIAGPTRLVPGDRVRVGDTTFEIEATPAPAQVERPAAAFPAQVEERPAGAAPPEPVPAPGRPFDPAPQRPRRQPAVATRRLTPTVLAFGTVIATAIALVLYFAMR
ncbi:MAG TPA: FHA domain-containing protein [Actinomycetota bacterium]|jgi:predicted component of type VI protein secretion system|nr:FHA domain-containing protein [Actinomycetota bacterium]